MISINQRLFQKKIFKRILIALCSITFILIIAVSFALSAILIDRIEQNFITKFQSSLEKTNSNLNDQLDMIIRIHLALIHDFDSFFFMSMKEYDPYITNRAYIQAKLLKQLNPYILTITLANLNIGETVQTGFSEVYSTDILAHAWNDYNSYSQGEMKIIYPEVTNELSEHYGETTLSFLFSEKGKGEENGFVLITLDKDHLKDELLNQDQGVTLVCNMDGDIILSSKEFFWDDFTGGNDLFSNIRQQENRKGYIIQKKGIEDNIVNYIYNQKTGYYIITFNSTAELTGEIMLRRNIMILAALFILILSFLIIYFLAEKIYDPIKKITKIFSNSQYIEMESYFDELELINEVYKSTLKSLESLTEKNILYEDKEKRTAIRNILKDNYLENEKSQKLLDIKTNLDKERIFMICMTIDQNADNSMSRLLMFENTLKRLFDTNFSREFNYEIIDMFQLEYVILLSSREQDREKVLVNIIENLELLIQEYTDIFNSSFSCGVADNPLSFDNLRQNYLQAREYLSYKFLYGTNKVYHKGSQYTNQSQTINFPFEIETAIIDAIKHNDLDEYIDKVSILISTLKNYPVTDANYIIWQVSFSTLRTFREITLNSSGLYYIKFDIYDFIQQFTTIENVQEWMIINFHEYRNVLMNIQSLQKNKYYLVIEEAKQYINENYTNSELTIDMMAKEAGYTTYYFSKIFKDLTNWTLKDYIRHIRIEKAKAALTNSTDKLNTVGISVGLRNTSYFCSIFKKDVGLTPTEYRELVSSQSKN